MLNNTLVISDTNCPPSCTLCIEACSRRTGAVLEPVIEKIDLPELEFHSVLTCNQCSQPDCLGVCPTGAISQSADGKVVLDSGRCVGCSICNLVCPYGGISPKLTEHKSQKCDLCTDDPQCSKVCPNNILTYDKAGIMAGQMGEDLLSPGLPYCAGCGMELVDRHALRILGKDIVLFGAPSCNVLSSKARVPYYGTLMTQVASSATGVSRYFRHIGKDTICLAIIGDGATADLGFGQLSAAAERGERILYICYDNEAYMNTGVQRSSTTPFGSWTNTTQVGTRGRGRQGTPKNVPLLMAYHGIKYTATATLAYPEDFMRKLIKAKEAVKEGMAYIHVLAPCPTGWKFDPSRVVEVTKAAVETNYFPLWEAENGRIKLTHEVRNPVPIGDFTRMMKRFSHLSEEELRQLQGYVDQAFAQVKRIAVSNV
ncbi:thiamine pyrophosphate-dependent enzyme [Sporomusa sp.]|uniref:thiamine pyrophosphate-dependent enzyme n=1 Tax=Sporomusa sp. TaxID=2078658 RepID=UPI002BD108AC|nr:thiamine pyrophosphate-dependent enzyme [Sporomusa sp.]HWR09464.1 thiamine pyrophosphate-dependent enzyme [Sporomusa sp.]